MTEGTEGGLRDARCGRGAVVAVALQKELACAICRDVKTYKQTCSAGTGVPLGLSLKVNCCVVDSGV